MTQKAGQLIDRIGPSGYRHIPESSLQYDPFVQQAKENPGHAVLVAQDFDMEKAKVLRKRRREPWYTDDGHVVVRLLHSTVRDDGVRRGDLIFEWEAR